MSKLLFESKTCSRCAGSGSYSYCSMYGSTCFKCRGLGEVLTKRGAAAQAFFTEHASKPAAEFKAGDLIRFSHADPFERVLEVKIEGEKCIVECERKGVKSALHTSVGSLYRYGLTAEEKKAHVAEAMAYQATLTKMGKPRKEKS